MRSFARSVKRSPTGGLGNSLSTAISRKFAPRLTVSKNCRLPAAYCSPATLASPLRHKNLKGEWFERPVWLVLRRVLHFARIERHVVLADGAEHQPGGQRRQPWYKRTLPVGLVDLALTEFGVVRRKGAAFGGGASCQVDVCDPQIARQSP